MKNYESPAAKVVLLTLTDVVAASAEASAPDVNLRNAGVQPLSDITPFLWDESAF
ncbi:MAG: hypothetical protein IJS44_01775 [Clostridia bacterium]|nr:hypothetical protein [Clostridia bacterium]